MSDRTLISFDYAIKYLLKNKGDYDIVEGFISALLATEGYPPVKITALLESESNKEDKSLKKSIADLIVEDRQGNKYIVEIDRSYTTLFLHKACFNSCRLIVDSISTNEDYNTIKKVYHINLLYFPFAKMQSPLYHGKTIFHEIDDKHPQNLHLANMGGQMFDAYNIFPEYFIISVPLFNDVVKREIDEWLYLIKYSEVKADFKSPYMKKVVDRLNILKMTPKEREIYHSFVNKSLKERDYIISAEEKGREEGKEEEKIIMAKALLVEGDSVEKIMRLTGLTKEQIKNLKSLSGSLCKL